MTKAKRVRSKPGLPQESSTQVTIVQSTKETGDINANSGGFVSKSRFKDYFATARIACPKVQVGQPKSWESLPFWQTLKRVMKSPKYFNWLSKLRSSVNEGEYPVTCWCNLATEHIVWIPDQRSWSLSRGPQALQTSHKFDQFLTSHCYQISDIENRPCSSSILKWAWGIEIEICFFIACKRLWCLPVLVGT